VNIIYKLTNIKSKSPQSYIGFTSTSLETRWKGHVAGARHLNTLLANAIKKYGVDAFIKEVLYTSDDVAHTLNVMEEHFIRLHQTHFVDGSGYNMTYGGDGVDKGTIPWNKGNGAYMIGNNNPMFGKNHNPSTIKKISQAKTGAVSPRKGVILSNQTKSLLRNARLKHSKTYSITAPDGMTETTSHLKEFCSKHNLNLSHMIEVANGKHKHHKGYRVTLCSAHL
jgi:group I intron endonuclease